MGLIQDITCQYLDKFPNVPKLTLAKKMYKENPLIFHSVENARQSIRRLKEGRLNGHGKPPLITKYLQPKTYDSNPFKLPESFANDFSPFIISQSKTLIIGDLHFPYHDNQAITLALKYGINTQINCVVINGDLLDFATISRHEKDWRQRSVGQEFEATRVFLNILRDKFPNARIVFKHGNHDERWEKWLFIKAPELFDCTDFQLEVLLKLGELKIETVKDKRPIKIGKLNLLHGHELPGGSGGVNPARATFMKTMEDTAVNHFHKTTENNETTMNGDVISVRSIGCLCGLTPHYMPINKHNQGFAFCELDVKTGEYFFENLKIIKGKIYK
jgi:predicted phosphodiesterase